MEFPSRPVRSLANLLGAALVMAAPHALAASVACHYTYGGETRVLAAPEMASPFEDKGVQVGSYFRFRVVFQTRPADLASIKIYTYGDRDEGPVLIHQASYPYPLAGRSDSPYGFTGLQFVYEPVRDSELQYWCGMAPEGGEGK